MENDNTENISIVKVGLLMLIHDNLKINNIEYSTIVYSVETNAEKILNNPVHNHFTDHSISHSNREC